MLMSRKLLTATEIAGDPYINKGAEVDGILMILYSGLKKFSR